MAEFWSKQELSYQHVHLFWSYWIGFVALNTGCVYWYWAGLLFGICLELYQWLHSTQSDSYLQRKWLDVIRDLVFWGLGTQLNFLTKFN